jgi:tetratricopeptide (TPR) repeat protein
MPKSEIAGVSPYRKAHNPPISEPVAFVEVTVLALASLYIAWLMQDPAARMLQQGLIDLRAGNYQQAKTELEQASHAQPGNAFAWVSLAEVYRRLHQTAEAERAAGKSEQTGATQPAIQHALALFYSAEGHYAHAAKLEEQYAASPKADAQALSRAGGWYFQAGDDTDGERLYKAVWERAKTDPDVAFQYAQLRLHKLDFGGAADAVTPALSAHPGNAQLTLTMGVARYGQRRFEEAVDEFLKVIALDPSVPQPYDFLGRMLEQAGARLPQIRKAFEKWAAANPDNAQAQLLLAKVRLSEDAKDATAENLLRRSVSLNSNAWEAHYELGTLLETKRDFRGAAEELKRSSELNPGEPMPHYHLARVYDRLGDSDQAKAERQKHADLIAAGK